MPTEDRFSFKEQLMNVQAELKKLNEAVIELTIINRHLSDERNENSIRIDRIDNEITEARGAISLLKWIATISVAWVIGFCVWIVTNNIEQQSKNANLMEKIVHIEGKLERNKEIIHDLKQQLATGVKP